MVLLDDALYQETKDLAMGRAKPGPLLAEFADWFLQAHSGEILNIEFGQVKAPVISRYRLRVILANADDPSGRYQQHEAQVAAEFRRVALKHRFAEAAQLENLLVWYINFAEEARTEANWKATPQLKDWARLRYPAAVWEVQAAFSTSVVFYYRDADIALNEGRGISSAIMEMYYALLQRHDELHYFTSRTMHIKFDSKENVDKNYAGNLSYYFL